MLRLLSCHRSPQRMAHAECQPGTGKGSLEQGPEAPSVSGCGEGQELQRLSMEGCATGRRNDWRAAGCMTIPSNRK